MNSHVLVAKNHQNRSKTIKNRKIHPGAFPELFSLFFAKFHFSRKFQTFWYRSLKAFSRFCQIGHAVHPIVSAAVVIRWRASITDVILGDPDYEVVELNS